jgi:gliding motility-associated-like protein
MQRGLLVGLFLFSLNYAAMCQQGGATFYSAFVAKSELAAPVCVNDSFVVFNDLSAIRLHVTKNDIITSPGPFAVTIVQNAKHGTTLIENNDSIVYTPLPGYSGRDSIRYRLCDVGLSLCSEAMVYLRIQAPNIAPTAVDDYVETVANQTIRINAIQNDLQNDGDSIFINLVSESGFGTVKNNNDGSITYIPSITYTGKDTIIYRLCDSGIPVYCTEGKIIVTVLPPGEPSLLIPNAFSPNGDGINDKYEIEGIENFNARLIIFNPWGDMVFSMDSYDNSWDGSYNKSSLKAKLNNEKLPSGTYFYILTYRDLDISHTGFILLSR